VQSEVRGNALARVAQMLAEFPDDFLSPCVMSNDAVPERAEL
jgi:hypothetical protein